MKVNKIYNEDCLDTIERMPDDFVDLVITSPPYNCGLEYDVYPDNKPWGEYLKWCQTWLNKLYRIVKPTGRLCVNVPIDLSLTDSGGRVSPFVCFYTMIRKAGFKTHGNAVWIDTHRVKYTAWGSYLMSSAPYIYTPFEIIIIAYKESWKRRKGKTEISKEQFIEGCSGVWKLGTETKKWTQANFPESLPDMCIRLLSNEGDLVYDPFGGGGTTCVVAKKLRRNWIMSEISRSYCKVAAKRIKSVKEDSNDSKSKC